MALLDCLSWIPYLWVHGVVDLFFVRERKKLISDLFPDDLAMEILVRLSVEDIMNCRRVCKSWVSLTSTPYFIESHLKSATPCLFTQVNCLDQLRFFIPVRIKADDRILMHSKIDVSIPKKLNPWVISSCNGLLLFEACLETRKYIVINPITQEHVSFDPPTTTSKPGSKACAIYFHPSTRDYKVLYWEKLCSDQYQYYTYSLRARTWTQISTFSCRPAKRYRSNEWMSSLDGGQEVYESNNDTVVMNGCLHWMGGQEVRESNNDTIMIYRIDKEDFRAMPHPGHKSHITWNHTMILSQMDERLTFCRMMPKSLVIDVWVLQDYENWGWVQRVKIHLGRLRDHLHSKFCCKYINSPHCLHGLYPNRVKLLGIQNGELFFDWASKGIFCHHIKLIQTGMVQATGLSRIYMHTGQTVSYTKSLVSPVNL